WILRARVRAAVIALLLVFMAGQAGLLADVPGLRRCRRDNGVRRRSRRRGVLLPGTRRGHGDHDGDPERDRCGNEPEGTRVATHRSSLYECRGSRRSTRTRQTLQCQPTCPDESGRITAIDSRRSTECARVYPAVELR